MDRDYWVRECAAAGKRPRSELLARLYISCGVTVSALPQPADFAAFFSVFARSQ